jgi:glucose-1-phosphate adenylyltransferase
LDRVVALILAGGAGERLSLLVTERAKPSVPYGGRYRIIDFTLSNCVNSGISNVAVLTQYNPRSLVSHIGIGYPWYMDRARGNVSLFQPFLSRADRDWYKGTADAVYQNLYFLEDVKADEAFILSGDHIYIMRYDRMVSSHRSRKADVTIAVCEVPQKDMSRFGIVTMDHTERIVDFSEKPKKPVKGGFASMGIYVFNKNVLIECLEEDAGKKGSHDFGKDILPNIIGKYNVYGYKFNGYWRDVGTIESYWQANMDLITELPELNLYNPETEIKTVQENLAPAKFGPHAQVERALVSNGAIVNGRIENSIVFPRAFIEEGAYVKDSIVFSESTIGQGSMVDKSIIDKQVWIGAESLIGYGDDYTVNKEEPNHLDTGITLVGKGARLPGNIKIGRNCKIGCWVENTDFDADTVASGESIVRKKPRRYSM